MTSTDLAIRGAARGALALTPDQTDWTPQQLAALRQLGIEDAPEGDLLVFRHVCQATGLDPFRKQIYMIGRKTKVKYWDDRQRKQVEDWVMKYTIQTGIDGYRKNGRQAAAREGDKIRVDGPYWQGADGGGWQDVWLGDKPPAAAKFTIFRDGEAHVGIAMYREFVQTAPGSDAPNSMWRKMPANQLAKCAEAQSWRRAYPDDFSAMQLEDSAQIIDPDGAPAEPSRVRSERVSAAGIIEARRPGTASDPGAKPEDSQVQEPAAKEPTKRKPRTKQIPQVTDEQLQQIKALLEQLGTPQDEMRARVSEILEFDSVIDDARRLAAVQGDRVIAALTARAAKATPGQVTAVITAMDGDRIPENERLNWARTAMRNPDLAALEDLTSEQADEIVIYLTTADEPQGDGEQLPMDGAEGGDQ